MLLKNVNVLKNIIKKFVNGLLLNILFLDYSHSLGWYWELPVIPGLVVQEVNIIYIGYYWSPTQVKEHDMFILWYLGSACLIAGWSWFLSSLYSLFILRDLSIASVIIRGAALYNNTVYVYFIFLPEIVNILTLNTSTDYAFFFLIDGWLVKITAVYLWAESNMLARASIYEAWSHHIRRNKIFGTMLIRNVRARNRNQREAIVYLIVVPLVYLSAYLSAVNIGEAWHVTHDQWIRWFVYLGSWHLPYYYPGNTQGYQGNNYEDLQSFMSDYYPWWYIPGNAKGGTYFVTPYARNIEWDNLNLFKRTQYGGYYDLPKKKLK